MTTNLKFFDDEKLQKSFEVSVQLLGEYEAVLSSPVESGSAHSVAEKLERLINGSYAIVSVKAKLDYILEKYVVIKIRSVLDMENGRSAADRKAILSAEVGGVNYYCNLAELLIKESHYQIEALRSLLSWHKSEMENL